MSEGLEDIHRGGAEYAKYAKYAKYAEHLREVWWRS